MEIEGNFWPFPGSVLLRKRNHAKSSILYRFWNYFLEEYSFAQNTIFFHVLKYGIPGSVLREQILSKVRLSILYMLMMDEKYLMFILYYYVILITKQTNNV